MKIFAVLLALLAMLSIPAQADEALRHAGAIAAHYFGEAKGHMLELEASWDLLEVALAERGMHDDEVDTQ